MARKDASTSKKRARSPSPQVSDSDQAREHERKRLKKERKERKRASLAPGVTPSQADAVVDQEKELGHSRKKAKRLQQAAETSSASTPVASTSRKRLDHPDELDQASDHADEERARKRAKKERKRIEIEQHGRVLSKTERKTTFAPPPNITAQEHAPDLASSLSKKQRKEARRAAKAAQLVTPSLEEEIDELQTPPPSDQPMASSSAQSDRELLARAKAKAERKAARKEEKRRSKGKQKATDNHDDEVDRLAERDPGGSEDQIMLESKKKSKSAKKDNGKGKQITSDTVTPTGGDLRYAAEILCTKWLTPAGVKALALSEGFTPVQGQFSKSEQASIAKALEVFRLDRKLTQKQLDELIMLERPSVTSNELGAAFWPALARAVEMRPMMAVYRYVKRKYAPAHRKGPWTEEEVETFRAAHARLGNKWVQIAELVGRQDGDCRDFWRDNNQEWARDANLGNGTWSEEEVKKLEKVVAKRGDTNWQRIARKVGTRTRKQCLDKWLSIKFKATSAAGPSNSSTRFVKGDRPDLVASVQRTKPTNLAQIDWSTILKNEATPDNISSRPIPRLKAAWKTLIAEAEAAGESTAKGKLAWLSKRYPEGQPVVTDKKWESQQHLAKPKVAGAATKSAEFISDSDEQEDDDE